MTRASEFAMLLKGHLLERGLTQEWLAHEVHIAPASLSRALRGARRPSAELLLRIADTLGLSPEDEQRLLSAQGYGRAANDLNSAASELEPDILPPTVLQALEHLQRRVEAIAVDVQEIRRVRVADLAPAPTTADDEAKALEQRATLFKGEQLLSSQVPGRIDVPLSEAVRREIQLLRQAADHTVPRTIYLLLTGQNYLELLPNADDLFRPWLENLQAALRGGWHCIEMVHLPKQAAALVREMFSLFGSSEGRYQPRYLAPTAVLPDLDGCIVAEGVGALQIFPRAGATVSLAWFTPEQAGYKELFDLCVRLRLESIPLVTDYDPGSPRLMNTLLRMEDLEGERCALLDGLNKVIVPLDITRARSSALITQDAGKMEAAEALCRLMEQRQHAFLAGLLTGRARDICSKQSVRRLVEQGVYASDDPLSLLGAPPETPAQRASHLEALIALLEDRRRYYELGLLEDDESELYRASWLVKRGHTVILDVWLLDERTEPRVVKRQITEPSNVESFCARFDEIWQLLKPCNSEKAAVISWLKEQHSLLPT